MTFFSKSVCGVTLASVNVEAIKLQSNVEINEVSEDRVMSKNAIALIDWIYRSDETLKEFANVRYRDGEVGLLKARDEAFPDAEAFKRALRHSHKFSKEAEVENWVNAKEKLVIQDLLLSTQRSDDRDFSDILEWKDAQENWGAEITHDEIADAILSHSEIDPDILNDYKQAVIKNDNDYEQAMIEEYIDDYMQARANGEEPGDIALWRNEVADDSITNEELTKAINAYENENGERYSSYIYDELRGQVAVDETRNDYKDSNDTKFNTLIVILGILLICGFLIWCFKKCTSVRTGQKNGDTTNA